MTTMTTGDRTWELKPSEATVLVQVPGEGGLPILHRADCWGGPYLKARPLLDIPVSPEVEQQTVVLWWQVETTYEAAGEPRTVGFCEMCMVREVTP